MTDDNIESRIGMWCRTYREVLAACCTARIGLETSDAIGFRAANLAWGELMQRCSVNPKHGYHPVKLQDITYTEPMCDLCRLTPT